MKTLSLKGKRVAFTGFRDEILEDRIKQAGGIITSIVSGYTNILISEGDKGKNSDKMQKALHYNIIILSKDEFVLSYLRPQEKNNMQVFFGSFLDMFRKKDYNYKFKVEGTTKITSKTIYYTHDNGTRPFKVIVDKQEFCVYKQSKIGSQGKGWKLYDGSYDTPIIKPTKYINLFVGKDTALGKKYDGNSLLFKTTANTYIFIGKEIFTFKVKDEIISFVSDVWNSDAPFPYAIGEKNTYLLTEYTYLSNDTLTFQNPYEQLYNMCFACGEREKMKVLEKYKKTHKLSIKLLHKIL